MTINEIALHPVEGNTGTYEYGFIYNGAKPFETIACMAFQNYSDVLALKERTNAHNLHVYEATFMSTTESCSTTSGYQITFHYFVTMEPIPSDYNNWTFQNSGFREALIDEIKSRYAFFLNGQTVSICNEDYKYEDYKYEDSNQ